MNCEISYYSVKIVKLGSSVICAYSNIDYKKITPRLVKLWEEEEVWLCKNFLIRWRNKQERASESKKVFPLETGKSIDNEKFSLVVVYNFKKLAVLGRENELFFVYLLKGSSIIQ